MVCVIGTCDDSQDKWDYNSMQVETEDEISSSLKVANPFQKKLKPTKTCLCRRQHSQMTTMPRALNPEYYHCINETSKAEITRFEQYLRFCRTWKPVFQLHRFWQFKLHCRWNLYSQTRLQTFLYRWVDAFKVLHHKMLSSFQLIKCRKRNFCWWIIKPPPR